MREGGTIPNHFAAKISNHKRKNSCFGKKKKKKKKEGGGKGGCLKWGERKYFFFPFLYEYFFFSHFHFFLPPPPSSFIFPFSLLSSLLLSLKPQEPQNHIYAHQMHLNHEGSDGIYELVHRREGGGRFDVGGRRGLANGDLILFCFWDGGEGNEKRGEEGEG